jgi:hypothetical protein
MDRRTLSPFSVILLLPFHQPSLWDMGKKATNAESAIRTNAVYALLGKGWSRQQIMEYSNEKWGISRSQTDQYIAKARRLLTEDCDLQRSAWIAEALQRLRKLEQTAADKNQISASITAIQMQAKLIGLE